MKLYDGAVLLIIGAAVVGPIEPLTSPCAETFTCQSRALLRESFAETCERAMREIGAKPILGRDGYEFFVDGSKVRCIPAPSGLRK